MFNCQKIFYSMLSILIFIENLGWCASNILVKSRHHHHLFLKRPFLPRSARVRRFSRYEASPHIPEPCPFRMQTKLIRIILYTFSPSLPAPTHITRPCHHHISTGRHPIISTLTFNMPKPPQYTTPHHLSHALNTQKTVQDLNSLLYHVSSWPPPSEAPRKKVDESRASFFATNSNLLTIYFIFP